MHRASEIEELKTWGPNPQIDLASFKKALRLAWRRTFGNLCQSCKFMMFFDVSMRQNKRYATLDHIEARALGGKNDLQNIQIICKQCNNKKSADEYRKSHHYK